MIRSSLILLLIITTSLNGYCQSKYEDLDILQDVRIATKILQKSFYNNSWECSKEKTNPWNHENIWNAYNTLEVLIDYSVLTRDTAYIPIIKKFASNKCAYHDSKYAGYDDAQWTGIALIKAYQLLNKEIYLQKAIELWNYICENSWDSIYCSGGLWWNIEKTYKNAITNELFIVFSTMLYFETNEQKYNNWAIRTWKWFETTDMLSSETKNAKVKYLVNDGVNSYCKNNNGPIWSYNQALLIGGLVNLWKINKEEMYLDIATKIALSALDFLTISDILVERYTNGDINNSLNSDQQQFKGIFCRYISSLAQILPSNNSDLLRIHQFLARNYLSLLANYPDYNFGALWDKKSSKEFSAISQTSGIDLLLSYLKTSNIIIRNQNE